MFSINIAEYKRPRHGVSLRTGGQRKDTLSCICRVSLTMFLDKLSYIALAGVKYSFGELGVKTRHQYKYPKEVTHSDKSKVIEYFQKRCISEATLDYADVRQDEEETLSQRRQEWRE